MTAEPIRSLEELRNTIALGLDLWVLTLDTDGRRDVWKFTQPRLIQGARGLKLGNDIIRDDYIKRWGIEDHGCHHTVHRYGNQRMLLFNESSHAQRWKDEGLPL